MEISSGNSWRELAAQKEKEWRDVTEQRILTLEQTCAEKEKLLNEERGKFLKLKEDFKYNLKLLEERDHELDRYDSSFSDAKAQLNAKTAEVSECKILIDELKTQINCEAKSREELQLHYQARLREKQAEIDAYRNTKDGEMQEERKEFESFKRKLQRQLTQVEEEMDSQKREITADFEEAMRKREHEFRIKSDELNAKVLEYELKAKLLGKELELSKVAQQKNSQEFSQAENHQRNLEKKVKEREWEIQDMRALKDSCISELESQLHQKDLALTRLQEDYNRKHSELDKYCREKETALSAAKEAFTARDTELQNEIRNLQTKCEDLQVEICKLQWANQDLEKEKHSAFEKYEEQACHLREQWDRQLGEVSRGQVSKDLELQALRESEDKLRSEVAQKKEDIDRYKKELSAAVERESNLERSKAQLELDWQRRVEDLERLQYEKSEDLVKKLTRSRDEAQAQLKEKTRELEQRERLIHVLQTVREQCLAALKEHDISLDKRVEIDLKKCALVSKEEFESLQDQNSNLKLVIREMRAQMEQLGHKLPSPREPDTVTVQGHGVNEDYVKDLEQECRKLRQQNRELEQDSDVARRFGRPPVAMVTNQEEVLTEVKDNMLVKTHIQSLNALIGSLRAEKVELSAQVKKQQANILFHEKAVEKHQKQIREKQVEVDQLQYELGAVTRRSQTEVASLRQKVSDFELQLLEARKEADEYYRSNLERNMEVTSLGQELSNLKLQLSEKRPGINYGAQELLIQQLQDEIMSLRHQGAALGGSGSESGSQQGSLVRSLQGKLRDAAKKITELAKERHQLIEMGNKLRAELMKAGVEPSSIGPSSARPTQPFYRPIRDQYSDHVTPSHDASDQQNTSKLNQLEKLQYELTRQQLQYAQRYQRGPGDTQTTVSQKEMWDTQAGLSDTEEYRPPSILKKPSHLRESVDTEIDVRASVNTEGGETIYSVPTARSQLLLSMSSMGGESLQEIWKMLDNNRPSPTPRTASPQRQGNVSQMSHDSQTSDVNMNSNSSGNKNNKDSLYLSGKQTGQKKAKLERKLSDKAAGKVFKKVPSKTKIRNYNLKEDEVSSGR